MSMNGTPLDPDAIAYPCGIIARSLFNDTYNLTKLDSQNPQTAFGLSPLELNENNIAWKSDVDYKFKNQAGNYQDIQWVDVENQHFIVWMRTAGLPSFRKLYGQYNEQLTAGQYQLSINNTYDVSSFGGSKTFVLATTNGMGG